MPYVGGGSGGSGGPLTGVIDGGVYTGIESNVQCGPPQSPAASQVVQDGERRVVVSWGPAYPLNPESTSITGYEVQFSQNASGGDWFPAGRTESDPEQTVPNFAFVSNPEPRDPTGAYFYRVRAILSPDAEAEWGYTGEYRHFQEPLPTDFELSPATGGVVGSRNAVDNTLKIYVANLVGDVQLPIEWTTPEVTGLSYTEENGDNSLLITNNRGAETQNQSIVVQCTINNVTRSATVQIQNTTPDTDDPDPIGGSEFIPVFNWELVPEGTDELAQQFLPGLQSFYGIAPPFETFEEGAEGSRECGYDDHEPCEGLVGSRPGLTNCGIRPSTLCDFTDFSIIMQSPYSGPMELGDEENNNELPVNQFQKLNIPGSDDPFQDDCSVGNLKTPSGENLRVPNPMYVTGLDEELIFKDPDGRARDIIQPPRDKFIFKEKQTAYQIVDKVSLNGNVASYLLGNPAEIVSTRTQEQSGDRDPIVTTRKSYASGFLMCSKSSGSSWSLISPKGGLGYKIGPDSENSFPMLLAKAKSVKSDQEVLVALYKFQTEGALVEQFYFTVDHTNWYPCSNADRLPSDIVAVWYHDGVTYAISPTYNGYKSRYTYPDGTRKPYYRSPPREQ